MNFYRLSYGSPEDSGELTFTHKSLFTKEMFDEVVEDAYVEALLLYIKDDKQNYRRRDQFSALFSDKQYLINAMKLRDFEVVQPILTYSVSGWSALLYPGDWADENEQQYNLQKRLRAAYERKYGPMPVCTVCGKSPKSPWTDESECDICKKVICTDSGKCYSIIDAECVCNNCKGA